MELDLKVKYGELLDLYANLLTDKQVKQMEEYMLYDLSLTEIAQNNNSSRQAVYSAHFQNRTKRYTKTLYVRTSLKTSRFRR